MLRVVDDLLDALRRAVEAAPDDPVLRAHLGELLISAGDPDGAIVQATIILGLDPESPAGRALMSSALRVSVSQGATVDPIPRPDDDLDAGFDWDSAFHELEDPGTVTVGASVAPPSVDGLIHDESPLITLRDVGGMQTVKDRIEAAFIAPLRNPELRALYGSSLRGGLLMYGPPGCGKTFMARAVAGELDASFLSVALHDVLDPMLGVSERLLHQAFEQARASAPCVLFLDEVDAIGQRRSHTRNSGMHGVVVQLLEELDGMGAANDGVFVLGASNQPWDIDPALRRPGRFDRTVLVLPPDTEARVAILALHLRDRPVSGDIDLVLLARLTDGYTGADLAHICSSAAEVALLDSVRSGTARPISMADLTGAAASVRSSATTWLDSVKNLVAFGQDDGTFGELRDYLKKGKGRR